MEETRSIDILRLGRPAGQRMKGGIQVSKPDVTLTAHVDQTEVDLAISKAERLAELLKEARSLAGELASMEIPISVILSEE